MGILESLEGENGRQKCIIKLYSQKKNNMGPQFPPLFSKRL